MFVAINGTRRHIPHCTIRWSGGIGGVKFPAPNSPELSGTFRQPHTPGKRPIGDSATKHSLNRIADGFCCARRGRARLRRQHSTPGECIRTACDAGATGNRNTAAKTNFGARREIGECDHAGWQVLSCTVGIQ